MKTAPHIIMLGDIPVEVTRKKMKTLRLGVYPPDGRVRISAPLKASDETVLRMATERLAWIERQRRSSRPSRRPRRSTSSTASFTRFSGTLPFAGARAEQRCPRRCVRQSRDRDHRSARKHAGAA
jgi:predicted metal-dependent hydrolase